MQQIATGVSTSLVTCLTRRLAGWIQSRADDRAAAALYESQRMLSNHDLRNRELSRDAPAKQRDRVPAASAPDCS
jgi:hypothetical protein